MKEYDNSTALWNKVYGECKLEDLTEEQLSVEPTFDACLEIFSKQAKRVLDFGCGTGDILLQCKEYGHLCYGIGIDRSEAGINFATQMAELNHYKQLDFVVGDINYFTQMEDGSFDGIIVSNVLDVIPKEVEVKLWKELTRLLKDGGLMFVKLNPYSTEEELNQLGLKRFRSNLYEKDGILRVRNLTTDAWKRMFEKDFTVERYLEFLYPWQGGLNRLFLLKKKSPVK